MLSKFFEYPPRRPPRPPAGRARPAPPLKVVEVPANSTRIPTLFGAKNLAYISSHRSNFKLPTLLCFHFCIDISAARRAATSATSAACGTMGTHLPRPAGTAARPSLKIIAAFGWSARPHPAPSFGGRTPSPPDTTPGAPTRVGAVACAQTHRWTLAGTRRGGPTPL